MFIERFRKCNDQEIVAGFVLLSVHLNARDESSSYSVLVNLFWRLVF